ncbi:MAG: hypothetical protein BKP49_06505 [Treponema sp. CETP13]|nr:MAG: hypothetical protein BKP49_06505 [Treponema sp. CETP13]
MFQEMNKRIELLGLIPVIKIRNAQQAVQVGKALLAGGINAAEVCFRVNADVENRDAALQNIADGIAALRKTYPDMLVGAGTVINSSLAQKAILAGAQFIVAPGFNPDTVDYCIKKNVPVYPGVSSASEIEQALSRNLTLVKFFPVEALGGVKTLETFQKAFPVLKFMPSGGINSENVGKYMQSDAVAAVGGSWMVRSSLIEAEKWDEIVTLSEEAEKAMLGFEFAHLGINYKNEKECKKGTQDFAVFGFKERETPISWFCGNNNTEAFELMKQNGRGKNGHIGILVYSIERAMEYLKPFGYSLVPETIQWCGEPEKSAMFFVYLTKDIAGFDIHLKRK